MLKIRKNWCLGMLRECVLYQWVFAIVLLAFINAAGAFPIDETSTDGSFSVYFPAFSGPFNDNQKEYRLNGGNWAPVRNNIIMQVDDPKASQPNFTVFVSGAFEFRVRYLGANQGGPIVSDWIYSSNAIVVTLPNQPPVIQEIADRTINEDGTTGVIGLQLSDDFTPISNLSISASSSNTALVSSENITVVRGSTPSISVLPNANMYGSTVITVNVSDGNDSSSSNFTLDVNSVNDLPSVSAIGNRTVSEGIATGPLGFSVSDVESPTSSLTVSASSSNTTLVPNSSNHLIIGGSGSNRTINVQPVYGQSGQASITVAVSDGEGTSYQAFLLSVNVEPVANFPVPAEDSDGVFNITLPAMGSYMANRTVQYRFEGGIWSEFGSSIASITPVGGNTFQVNLLAGGRYEFRERQTGTAPYPPYTQLVTEWRYSVGATNVAGLPPKSPTIISTSYDYDGTYIFRWSPAQGEVDYYLWSQNNGQSYTQTTGLNSGELSLANGTYYFRVKACNAILGNADLCSPDSQQAVQVVADAPPSISASTTSSTDGSYDIHWVHAKLSGKNSDAVWITESGNNSPILVYGKNTSGAIVENISPYTFNKTLPGTFSYSVHACYNVSHYPPGITPVFASGTCFESSSIQVTVVDSPPTVANIPDQTIDEGSSTGLIRLFLSDDYTSIADLAISATSSNTSLVAPGDIVISSGNPRNISISPENNAYGVTRITVSVNDGKNTVTESFDLNVEKIAPSAPRLLTASENPSYNGSFNLSWQRPSRGTVYGYRWRESSQSQWQELGVQTSVAVTEDLNGEYSYEVVAYNNVGVSDAAHILVEVSRDEAPSLFTSATTHSSNRRPNFTWDIGQIQGGAPNGTWISVGSERHFVSNFASWAPSEDLALGQNTFSIVSCLTDQYDSNGEPSYNTGQCVNGNSIQLYIHGLPGQATAPVLSGIEASFDSNGSMDVDWSSVKYANRYVLRYQRDNGEGREVITFDKGNLQHTVKGLSDGQWSFTVQACNFVTTSFAPCGPESEASNVSVINFAAADIPIYDGEPLETIADPEADVLEDSDYWGGVQGGASVSDFGAFNYTVPIAIPKGVNGMQPNLSLSYSSNSSNGLLGQGWKLSGLSKIHRCGSDFIRDGAPSGIMDDQKYQYCLNGQRLVEVNESEYRTESESFLRIYNNDGYWTTIDNDGSVTSFGSTYGAREFSVGGQVRAWHLDLKTDIWGNGYTVWYQRGEDGRFRPDRINYTDTRSALNAPEQQVKFVYEDRIDIIGVYLAGALKIEDKRLSQILLKSKGAVQWRYDLEYQQVGQTYHGKLYDDPAALSRLYSIRRCVGEYSETCQNAIEFDWAQRSLSDYPYQKTGLEITDNIDAIYAEAEPDLIFDIDNDGEPEGYYREEDNLGEGKAQRYYSVDVNNDGFKDVVIASVYTNSFMPLNHPNENIEPEKLADIDVGDFEVYLNVVSGGERIISNTPANQYSFEGVDDRYRVVGVRTIVIYNPYYTEGSPNGFQPEFRSWDNDTIGYERQFVDVNRDGYMDLVFYPQCGARIGDYCMFVSSLGAAAFPPGEGPSKILTVFNSENGWEKDSYGNHVFHELASDWNGSHIGHPNFIDFNGDGLLDMVVADAHISSVTYRYREHIIDENGNHRLIENPDLETHQLRGLWGDYNGDGVLDVARINDGIDVRLGSGITLGEQHAALINAETSYTCNHVYGSYCSRSVVDFNGDGRDDIVETSVCKQPKLCGSHLESLGQPLQMSQVWLSLGTNASGQLRFSTPVRYRSIEDYDADGESFIPSREERMTFKRPEFYDYDNDGYVEHNYKQAHRLDMNVIRGVYSDAQDVSVEYKVTGAVQVMSANASTEASNDDLYENPNISEPLTSLPTRFAPAMRVVEQVRYSDGAGGERRSLYRYTEPKRHLGGYGNLGFKTIERRSTNSDINGEHVLYKTFSQEASNAYSLAGHLLESVSWYIDEYGNALHRVSRVRNKWKVRTYQDDIDGHQSPHYFPYIYQQLRENEGENRVETSNSVVRNYRPLNDRDCEQYDLMEWGAIVTPASSETDIDYTNNGVLKYSETLTCDASESESSVQFNAVENLDVKDLGLRRGLIGQVNTFAWVGGDLSYIRGVNATSLNKRALTMDYDEVGRLRSQTLQKHEGAGTAITTTYEYHVHGEVSKITESWQNKGTDESLDFEERSTSIGIHYDSSNGERTVTLNQPLIGDIVYVYDGVYHNLLSQTDANYLDTHFEYDAFGRLILASYPEGTESTRHYRSCDNCFGYSDSEVGYVQSKTTGTRSSRIYFDRLGRSVGSRDYGLNGDHVYTAQQFNSRGLVSQSTAPFYSFDAQQQTTHYTYDVFGRSTQIRYPDNLVSQTVYNGLQTTSINRKGQRKESFNNGAGWLVRSTDQEQTPVDFTYHAFGELASTTVNNNPDIEIRIEYDSLGRKTILDDPNTGRVLYDYNALGLVASQTDAKNQVTLYSYDELGRKESRTDDADGIAYTHHWIYDRQIKGALSEVNGLTTEGQAYSEAYSYTAFGMPATITANIEGENFIVRHHYDEFHRRLATTYPTGYQVATIYNSNGFAESLVATTTNQMLWRADDANASGQITRLTLGDGTVTNKDFDPQTGLIKSIHAQRNSSSLLNHSYTFDVIGNLTSRTDALNVVTQSFCYDNLNRLSAARFDGCDASDVDYDYDELGNIKFKAYVGEYLYEGLNGAGPNAVTSANGLHYEYDANGALIFARDNINSVVREVSYSAFGKPTRMSHGAEWSEIVYGPDQSRIKRTDSTGRTTLYLGSLFEKTVDGFDTYFVHTVNENVVFIDRRGITNETYHEFRHTDHIGSIAALTTDKASDRGLSMHAFSPWGERLNLAWDGVPEAPEYQAPSVRGFTGHEHLDPVGLVHMNGRVYDPELGRFLSPDPLIQAPSNSQSYNRYSYVWNNPLSYTDPTGYATDCGNGPNDRHCEETIVTGHRTDSGTCTEYCSNPGSDNMNIPNLEFGGFYGGRQYQVPFSINPDDITIPEISKVDGRDPGDYKEDEDNPWDDYESRLNKFYGELLYAEGVKRELDSAKKSVRVSKKERSISMRTVTRKEIASCSDFQCQYKDVVDRWEFTVDPFELNLEEARAINLSNDEILDIKYWAGSAVGVGFVATVTRKAVGAGVGYAAGFVGIFVNPEFNFNPGDVVSAQVVVTPISVIDSDSGVHIMRLITVQRGQETFNFTSSSL